MTVVMLDKDKSLQDQLSQVYLSIGKYISDHADTLASNVVPETAGVELVVKITPQAFVTLEQKTSMYVLKQGD